MKVVALADTHANDISVLPERLQDELRSADLIIHAGDYTGARLLAELRAVAVESAGEFRGVYGNMDPGVIRSELKPVEIIEIEGLRIGVTHPSEGGSPIGLMERVRKKFSDEERGVDVIIYGHSHIPLKVEKRSKDKDGEEVLYLNPGSATGAFPARYRSFVILYVEEGKGVTGAEIVKV